MAYLSLTTVGSSCHWSVYSSSAKAEMYFQNLGIYDFLKTSANLSYDQKCWHFSDHTNVVLTCSFVQRQRYCVNKLHLLATSLVANYWFGTATQSTKSLWHLAAGSLNYSIPVLQHSVYYSLPYTSTLLLMATVLLYNTECVCERFCMVFLAPTQLRRVR